MEPELVARQLKSLGVEELLSRGVSEKFARVLANPTAYDPGLDICVGPIDWEYAVPADAIDIVPLWGRNADGCVRWTRNGEQEYVQLYHDEPDWHRLAMSEQGAMACLWNSWCELHEGQDRRFAEAIGFRHWELAVRLWEQDYDKFEEWKLTFRG